MKSLLLCLFMLLTMTTGKPTFAVATRATPERRIHAAPTKNPTLRPYRTATIPADHGYRWGIAVKGHAFLYLAGYENIFIWDVSNPEHPEFIRSQFIPDLMNASISAYTADNDFIYLAAPNRVYVVDVTTVTLQHTYTGLESTLTAIASSNGWIYVLGTNSDSAYTLTAIHPTEGTTITDIGTHVACPVLQAQDAILAVGCSDSPTLYRLDDPAHPEPYATITRDTPSAACLPLRLDGPHLYLDNHVYRTDQNGALSPIHTIPNSSTLLPTTLARWGDYLIRLNTAQGNGTIVDIQEPATATPVGNDFLLASRGCGEIQSTGDMLYSVTESGFDLWQLQIGYFQHLPLLQYTRPYDPALQNEVGLFVELEYNPDSIGTKLFTLRLDGTPPRLVHAFETETAFVSNVTWSPNGERIFFTRSEGSVKTHYWINRDGTMLTPLPLEHYNAPIWSPDSRHLLFRTTVYDTVTQMYHQVNRDSIWSPDSQTLIYQKVTDSGGTPLYHIFATDADGKNPRQLTSGNQSVYFSGWVNNGAEFVARVGVGDFGTMPLYLYRADGTLIAPLAIETGAQLIFIAPNSQQFLYRNDSGLYLYTLSNHTSTPIPIPFCYGSKTCYSAVSWSPSSNVLSIGTSERGQPGQPDTNSFWIVPLTPTLQIPNAPFSTVYYYGTWVNDRYFTVSDFTTAEPTLVDRETGTQRPLFIPNGSRWHSYGWRHLP